MSERGGKCSECDGTGDEMVDSMTLYGIPGGYDVGGPCPACIGTGSQMAEHVIRELREKLHGLFLATDAVLDNYHHEHRQGCGGVPGAPPGDSDYCSVCDAQVALVAAERIVFEGAPGER